MTRYIKTLPFLMALLLFSCSKEESTFTPTEVSTQTRANLLGLVLDTNEDPVINAEVTYRGFSTTTNSSGVYKFDNAAIDSKHNTVSIIKDGYFEAARTFRTETSTDIIHRTTLLPKLHDLSFQSGTGGSIEREGVKIDFAPNTIVYDANQQAYNGAVNVAIKYLDPTDIDIDKKMPGDLTSITSDNEVHKSSSFGMVYVELQADNGDALQIKEGEKAILNIDVPNNILEYAPETVEASHFDQGLGLWKHESKATLTGNTYTTEVAHFSCWNVHFSTPSIIVTGRIVDGMGQPVSGAIIQVSEFGPWDGGFGTTNMNGVFSGAIPKDVPLNLYVFTGTYCNGTVNLAEDNIGPFASDVNIGDIVVDLTNYEELIVEATFVNCDGEPVTNGIAYIANQLFIITDGTLNVTLPACDNGFDIELWAHDLDTDKVTEKQPLVINQVNSFVNYSICQVEARYIERISLGLGIDERSMLEIGAQSIGMEKSFFCYFFDDSFANVEQMKLNYTDDESNGFKVGTWSISSATIENGDFPAVELYSADSDEGEVIIDAVGEDTLGKYIKGSYRIDFTDVNNTGNVYEFTGSFTLGTF